MANLKEMLPRIIKGLEQAVFPARCLKCGVFLPPSGNTFSQKNLSRQLRHAFPDNADFCQIMAPFICQDCAATFSPLEPPICQKCGFALKKHKEGGPLCDKCSAFPPLFRIARAYGTYDHILKEAIHLFKYRGKMQLADPLGMLLFSVFVRYWDTHDTDMIIPVPLHIRRFRKRGFNQAYLPLRGWKQMAKISDTDISHIRTETNILFRVRPTKTQVGMDREERQENIRDAFKIANSSEIREKKILLADDVITTGSTTGACARILLDNGARHVDVLTLAQTARRRSS